MNSPGHLRPGRADRWDTAGVLLDDAAAVGPFDLGEVFAEAPGQPIEIEIGVGKGTFLLARAGQRRDINFLGIEYARSYASYAADRIRRAGLGNVRIVCADAGHLFKACLASRCAWRVHIYFPDPWPKRRHHRRRLIQPDFISQVRRVLQPGGQLLIVTDHRDYFEHIRGVLNTAVGFAGTSFPRLLDGSECIVGTNFERKYLQQGRALYKIALVKYVESGL